MLARDFIDDCLYNPHYGYFSTQAVIFDPDAIAKRKGVRSGKFGGGKTRAEGFGFEEFSGSREFEDEIARRYGEFEGLNEGVSKGPGRQVWHTPTELFKVSFVLVSLEIAADVLWIALVRESDRQIHRIGI